MNHFILWGWIVWFITWFATGVWLESKEEYCDDHLGIMCMSVGAFGPASAILLALMGLCFIPELLGKFIRGRRER